MSHNYYISFLALRIVFHNFYVLIRYRSLAVCKHIEMHERGKGPPVDAHMRETVSKIMQVVKKGK